jgi:hypothetical protein
MAMFEFTPVKTYASRANAIRAVENAICEEIRQELRWFIAVHTDGRYFPVFVGERSVQRGIHHFFNVVG